MPTATDGPVVDLLQQLIRNACVNDGSADSGFELRSTDLLRSMIEGPGVDIETYESRPGRGNLVARITGSDPQAPSLCLLAHTDVVPVQPAGWERDPFGGELVDGVVWGRGAIDMLNLTASMALAMRTLADSGFRPKGDLIFAAVADEESGGNHGAKFLVERHADAVRADYVITESGGMPLPTTDGTALPVLVAERGLVWPRITVRGTPGHGSLPYGTDNALVKAAEVLRRITSYRVPPRLTETWGEFIAGMGLPEEIAVLLRDPEQLDATLDMLPPGLAKVAFSSTRTTLAPTGMSTDNKTNVIPDRVRLQLDVRTIPGDTAEDVRAMLVDAIGDLAGDCEIDMGEEVPATASPKDTPLWDAMERVARNTYVDGRLVPMLMVGGTDNRYFRPAGAVGYGFGLYSREMSLDAIAAMAHGDNERIDVESLRLITELWPALARDFLG
ncbi:MAG TPA: M20/M25/M40 family metallo-hydrolase [Mycobacteriales bacterium]|nr:M20/M25/M40 family metallo-hydrolase [Mycobacteriales bacterium]